MGRFLNADAFASTGQGLLGNNMFAYCNNSPTTLVDHHGNAPWPTTKYMSDGASSAKYIYNQNLPPYNDLQLGMVPVSHGGCGPIAAYNAMQILGKTDVSFDSIIEYFEQNNGLLLSGLIGTSIYVCAEYFKTQGYSVFMTTDVSTYASLASSSDASILWYWFDTNSFPYVGAHFIAFKQNGQTGTYYNAFANSKGPYYYAGDAYSFVSLSRGGCIPVLILIYKNDG